MGYQVQSWYVVLHDDRLNISWNLRLVQLSRAIIITLTTFNHACSINTRCQTCPSFTRMQDYQVAQFSLVISDYIYIYYGNVLKTNQFSILLLQNIFFVKVCCISLALMIKSAEESVSVQPQTYLKFLINSILIKSICTPLYLSQHLYTN